MANYKLRAFIRLDASGTIIPGSVVLRKSQPKYGRWQEITRNECCVPETTTTTTTSTTTTTTTTGA